MAATVAALCTLPSVGEVLVVDDGSVDNTAAVAERAGARVLRLPATGGKGAALAAGITAAAHPVVLLVDADLGDTARQADCLVAPVIDGTADMVIATFPVGASRGGGMGLVVRLARWGIRRACGRSMAAPLSGQRCIRRAVLDAIGGLAPGFGVEVALTIDSLRAGFTVVEVPAQMTHRVTGRDWRGVLHRGRQFAAVARALWRRRVWLLRGAAEARP